MATLLSGWVVSSIFVMSPVTFWEENVGAKLWFLCQLPHSLSSCCGVAIAKDVSGHNLDLGHVVWVSLFGQLMWSDSCRWTRIEPFGWHVQKRLWQREKLWREHCSCFGERMQEKQDPGLQGSIKYKGSFMQHELEIHRKCLSGGICFQCKCIIWENSLLRT